MTPGSPDEGYLSWPDSLHDPGSEDDGRLHDDLLSACMPGTVAEDEGLFAPETPAEIYLRDISRVPLLTADEEVMLAQRLEAGEAARARLAAEPDLPPEERRQLEETLRIGDEARGRLTESNLRLVVSVARKYMGRGLPLLDLVQEGNIGLGRAVEKYDWRRGYRFSTYAYWWIRQAVTRAIADQARTIRVPVHMVELIGDVHRAMRELQQELGREANAYEIAELLGTSPDRVQLIIRAAKQTISLESPVGDDNDNTVADMLADPQARPPHEAAAEALLRDQVADALASLTARERQVLRLRFGLADDRERTLGEIGLELGLSRERVRQIEAEAFAKLRQPGLQLRLRDYLD